MFKKGEGAAKDSKGRTWSTPRRWRGQKIRSRKKTPLVKKKNNPPEKKKKRK